MITLRLHVLGIPAPQGSKRHVGHGVMVEASKRVAPWREAVVSAARHAGIADLRVDEPVMVRVTFLFARPKAHLTTRGELRPNAPMFVNRTPDLDKCLRSTFDGLVQAGVIVDDKQIVVVHAQKKYADGTTPGALIHITDTTTAGGSA